MGSGFSRLSGEDSSVSRRFSSFHPENRRTFTLFTPSRISPQHAQKQKSVKKAAEPRPAVRCLQGDLYRCRVASHLGFKTRRNQVLASRETAIQGGNPHLRTVGDFL